MKGSVMGTGGGVAGGVGLSDGGFVMTGGDVVGRCVGDRVGGNGVGSGVGFGVVGEAVMGAAVSINVPSAGKTNRTTSSSSNLPSLS